MVYVLFYKNSQLLKNLHMTIYDIHKNIFACHNMIRLSCHEQWCLMRLRFERYFSHHQEKYLSIGSLTKHICSWLYKKVWLNNVFEIEKLVIQKYFENENTFLGIFGRNHLPGTWTMGHLF